MASKKPDIVIDPSGESKLTARQERFCREYLKHLNATRAAQAAGYAFETAHTEGSRLLANAKIKKILDHHKENRNKKLDLSIEDTLSQIKELATFDANDALDDDGDLLPMKAWPETLSKAVTQMEFVEYFEGHGQDKKQVGVLRKVKFIKKEKMVELMAKHQVLFKDTVDHTHTVTLEDLVLGKEPTEEK